MSTLTAGREVLVAANRILAHEGILDAYGHVSLRSPHNREHFLISRARAPELIEDSDLMEFDLNGVSVARDNRPAYIERFIHGAIYAVRPDVSAICHNHTASILPFGIVKDAPLQPVIHQAAWFGGPVPVWDMADEFGTSTDLLVRNLQHGVSLAATLGKGRLALMRAHGSVVTAGNLSALVSNCIIMDKNAKVLLAAQQLGTVTALHAGELANGLGAGATGPTDYDGRDWELWLRRVAITLSS